MVENAVSKDVLLQNKYLDTPQSSIGIQGLSFLVDADQ